MHRRGRRQLLEGGGDSLGRWDEHHGCGGGLGVEGNRSRRVSATVRGVRVCRDGRMGRGGIVRRPADAGQPQRACRRSASAAEASTTNTGPTAAGQGTGPEDRPMTPHRSRRATVEQLPRRRRERRRGAGDGGAGPTAAGAGTAPGPYRTGRVEHGEGGYPPTAAAEAQTGATSRGCSNVADVVLDSGLLLLLPIME